MAVYALVAVYAERKVSAFMQDRLGPMETGPYGIFQTAADILKLITKENIIPKEADQSMFMLAPLLVFVSVFAGYAVLPYGPGFGLDMQVGLLFAIGIVSVDVIGLFLAGWASNNKYSYIGAMRAIAQLISYEIALGLSLLCAVMMFGTLNLNTLSELQGIYSTENITLWGLWDVTNIGGILSWSIIRYPHLILVWVAYFIASLAQCNRAPFDIAESESEIIAGFHTEYSGFRFAVFFLAEYACMFLVGVLAAIVFFGGWNSPLPNISIGDTEILLANWTTGLKGSWSGALWGIFWLMSKGSLTVLLQMWIRWSVPRYRVDQLMKGAWKVLVPACFILFLVSGFIKLMEVEAWG